MSKEQSIVAYENAKTKTIRYKVNGVDITSSIELLKEQFLNQWNKQHKITTELTFYERNKILDLEAKLAESKIRSKESEIFYKREINRRDTKLRNIKQQLAEKEKEYQQLKDKLHTSEQETMRFHNKYFAEKQIAIEELNKVKELLLSKAIQITGTSVDGVRLYSINEIFSNQIKQLRDME